MIKAINTVFKNREEEFFTFDEFCKLRRATTDRDEWEAFFWFFDSFVECVCGASVWNNSKTKQLVTEARDPSQLKVVNMKDEAFAQSPHRTGRGWRSCSIRRSILLTMSLYVNFIVSYDTYWVRSHSYFVSCNCDIAPVYTHCVKRVYNVTMHIKNVRFCL